MTVTEEIAALQVLHGQQGYLVIGSVDPLPLGLIDPKVQSNDNAFYQARWSVTGESSRLAFEEQALWAFGRESGLRRMQHFYRVCALD